MNTNTMKSKGLRLGGLFLLAGTALSTLGCDVTSHLFFTVKGGDLEVTFCDKGAAIYQIKYKDTVVTYHPQNYNTFLKNDYYYGKALGRVAGRIKDGKFTLNGKEYTVDINEKDDYYKNNNIHGGKKSITTQNFKRNVVETDEYIDVKYTYFSPSMESGFPEDLDCTYDYKIAKKGANIELNITGVPSGPTIVNLSNHPYFRLANDGDILDHELTLPTSKYLAKFEMHDDNRTDQVVHGALDLDDETLKEQLAPFDFRKGKTIGKDIKAAKAMDLTSGGYDHIWKNDENAKECVIKLSNPKTKISLDVRSDADAVIMYANCYPHTDDEMNPSGKDSLYAGITVEPVKFFTNETIVKDLICTPDNPYHRYISYTFLQSK